MTQIKIQIKQNYIKNNMNTYLPANNNTPVPTREEFHRQYAGSICPVSYTHLDVYKRQLYSCLSNRIKTEVTRRNREKRKADLNSVSLDTPIGEGLSLIHICFGKAGRETGSRHLGRLFCFVRKLHEFCKVAVLVLQKIEGHGNAGRITGRRLGKDSDNCLIVGNRSA